MTNPLALVQPTDLVSQLVQKYNNLCQAVHGQVQQAHLAFALDGPGDLAVVAPEPGALAWLADTAYLYIDPSLVGPQNISLSLNDDQGNDWLAHIGPFRLSEGSSMLAFPLATDRSFANLSGGLRLSFSADEANATRLRFILPYTYLTDLG
jgi:hypothetical protein